MDRATLQIQGAFLNRTEIPGPVSKSKFGTLWQQLLLLSKRKKKMDLVTAYNESSSESDEEIEQGFKMRVNISINLKLYVQCNEICQKKCANCED